ncbi:TWiK family of potassium channels protein 7-like [Limulus polyphemus]|uniref:TWiK family of potassium channels protein 7-like n=1 Tax=Limulus polyphemus TaxID=6850 RepID=A0ABM1S419_LIMPO|nr:TWiK family of potassium channels protein 7-like [Limulus polyphemus]
MALERKRPSGRSGSRFAEKTPANKCKAFCRKFTAFTFSHVGLCGLVVGYSIMGAFAFRALEAPYEEEKAGEVIDMRQKTVKRLWDITYDLNVLYKDNWTRLVTAEIKRFQADLIEAVKDGYDGKELGEVQQWSFSGAFLYSLTVITTIGYGNIAPRTDWGKLVTIVYAIIGIPLMLLYLTNIGDILAKSFRYVYRRMCTCKSSEHYTKGRNVENYRVKHIVAHNVSGRQKALEHGVQDEIIVSPGDEVRIEAIPNNELHEDLDFQKPGVTVPITLCLLILVGYISGGAIIFSLWEGWGFLDGSYFCFVTLSTIGFGDLVPGDSVVSDQGSQEKLVICSLYLLIGMALIAMCFNLMQEEVIQKLRSCGRNIGIIKDVDDEADIA